MNDYRFYEDISCEEYYEAMKGFEQWLAEVQELPEEET